MESLGDNERGRLSCDPHWTLHYWEPILTPLSGHYSWRRLPVNVMFATRWPDAPPWRFPP
jgi:hypothetical protein